MKIKLSEIETYNFELPDEIEKEEFFELVEKLNKLSKLIDIDKSSKMAYKTKARNTKITSFKWRDSREKILDLMQYLYQGTAEDKDRISKITNLSVKEIYKRFSYFINKWKIKPNEVGLLKFGTKYTLPIKIKDYVIKSYTGYFDENGTDN